MLRLPENDFAERIEKSQLQVEAAERLRALVPERSIKVVKSIAQEIAGDAHSWIGHANLFEVIPFRRSHRGSSGCGQWAMAREHRVDAHKDRDRNHHNDKPF